jgi:hypothetical protein
VHPGPRLVAVAPPPDGIYRLARGPSEPFSPPAWDRAHDDGTFGNRFDDPSAADGRPPEQRFRAIYCATQREAVFGETVARFRPSIALLAKLAMVEDDEPIEEALAGAVDPRDPHLGLIPADWRLSRRIGHTVLDPDLRFVDVTAAESVQHLRQALALHAAEVRLADVDLSLLTSQQRRFTQDCARYVYDQVDTDGHPSFAGIRYPSRLSDTWECWAVFDDRLRHAPGWPSLPQSIFPDDRDLEVVASTFGLTIEVFPGHYLRP